MQDSNKKSLSKKLCNRNIQFQSCSQCLNETLAQNPIAQTLFNIDQALCQGCQNTNIHLVSMIKNSDAESNQAYLVYKKIFCKSHKPKSKYQCKDCSIYLNESNYVKCNFCDFSYFRKNMNKWRILYPIHKCEICNHYQCLKCKQVPSLMGNDTIHCESCESQKYNNILYLKNILKEYTTLKIIQFIIALLCITILTPFQIIGRCAYQAKLILNWRNRNEITLQQYIIQLLFMIIVGPILMIWIYLRYFLQFFSETYIDNIKIISNQILRQR